MHDPTVADSPHLSGAQPSWGDLPYACELLRQRWMNPEDEYDLYKTELEAAGKINKVRDLLSLLGSNKLDLLDSSHDLTPEGIWIANQFNPPQQRGLGDGVVLGRKQTLSAGEQAVWQTILFQRDWLPMLATINQLVTTTVSQKETDKRATDFRNRIAHLSGYQNVQSINSWKKKVQAHFQWAMYLGIAKSSSSDQYEPTTLAENLHTRLQKHYHPDWPV